MMWFPSDAGRLQTIWVYRSFDGGQTFGTDVEVTQYRKLPFPLPDGLAGIGSVFAVAADWTEGVNRDHVHIAYHDWNAEDEHADDTDTSGQPCRAC